MGDPTDPVFPKHDEIPKTHRHNKDQLPNSNRFRENWTRDPEKKESHTNSIHNGTRK